MAIDFRTQPVTAEEFLEFERHAPEGSHYELIEGQIREYPGVTTRKFLHPQITARISCELLNWLDRHPEIQGTVADGEARCRILAEPETIIGLDVAFFEGEQHLYPPEGQSFFDGPPMLAVEVLSNSDSHDTVSERIRLLLRAGVRQVWIADPDFQTVTVYRSDAEPAMFSAGQEIAGGEELPGFVCRVRRFFGGRDRD